jgi:hypothetical protein
MGCGMLAPSRNILVPTLRPTAKLIEGLSQTNLSASAASIGRLSVTGMVCTQRRRRQRTNMVWESGYREFTYMVTVSFWAYKYCTRVVL